ncbi:TPA: hypothetical protein ACITN2_004663 [Salmonella enterica subsp. enterica serovar Virchow]
MTTTPNRPDAVRAVRMFIHYDRAAEASTEAEYQSWENRREHYQDLVFALCPTDAEIIAGCGGIDGSTAAHVRGMLDYYAERGRKG